ncbi:uncharacterized protein LOC114828079 [Galendromus occidentalis]|uniref:Uncharacterized protein LOC114828079 n=1 Tax=Galendromus occidentalis TaxID=34638 RepID=A0AAJ7SDH5_9ACAR|nr:uncharacterized protein LOC114828079 [Galendromus occidentalis]
MVAELITASEACKAAIWTAKVLRELRYPVKPTLLIDNEATIRLTESSERFNDAKHVEMRFYYVRERYLNGEVNVEYCPSEVNAGDFLAKNLDFKKLDTLLEISGFNGGKTPGGGKTKSKWTKLMMNAFENTEEGIILLCETWLMNDETPPTIKGYRIAQSSSLLDIRKRKWMTPKVAKLNTQDEWAKWKWTMKHLLKAHRFEPVVTGAEVRPTTTAGDNLEKWLTKDAKAVSSIATALGDQNAKLVLTCDTSNDIWKILCARFERSSKQRLDSLVEQFYRLQKDDSEDMITHIATLQKLFMDMNLELKKHHQNELSEIMLTLRIMSTLGKEYNSFRDVWDTIPAGEQTVNLLIEKLCNIEKRDSVPTEQAFVASRKQLLPSKKYEANKKDKSVEKRKKFPCRKCHQLGHWARECTSVKDVMPKTGFLAHALGAAVDVRESTRWICDSGATCHMTPRREYFKTIEIFQTPKRIQLGKRGLYMDLLYADDLLLLVHSWSEMEQLLQITTEVGNELRLVFNPKKSAVLDFNEPGSGVHPELSIQGLVIPTAIDRSKTRQLLNKCFGMDKCAKCEQTIKKDGLACVRCHAKLHETKKCSGVSKASLDKDKKLRKTFVCDDCLASSDSEQEDDSPTEITSEKLMMKILSKISELDSKWQKKFDQFQSVIDMFSSQIDEVSELKARLKESSGKVKALEKLPRQTTEERSEVIISNVPPLAQEDPVKIAEAVFSSLEAGLSDCQILSASRFETKVDDKKRCFLKVKLSTNIAKGKVIEAARIAKATLKDLQLETKTGLKFADLNSLPQKFEDSPVFVNEAISKPTKILLQRAIMLKREKKVHTAWTYMDRVYVRKQQKSPPIGISCIADLEKLQSIRNRTKFQEFCSRLTQLNPQPVIILLIETWLSQNETTTYNIDGYQRLSCGREKQSRGGGIFAFIENRYHIETMDDQRMSETVAENLVFRISNIKPKLQVSVVYRPPKNNIKAFEDELDEQIIKMRSAKGIIVGDTNINWLSPQSAGVKEILTSHGWRNRVEDITRPAFGANLDHLYSNIPNASAELIEMKLSDHRALQCEISTTSPQERDKRERRINIDRLKERLRLETWDFIDNLGTASGKYSGFHEILFGNIERASQGCIGGKPLRARSRLPYISDCILESPQETQEGGHCCTTSENQCRSETSNPSAGLDGITAHTVKNVADEIAKPLLKIVNEIIESSEYPQALKRARVVPIPKVKIPSTTNDFRPISVLPVLNKVVERTLVTQLTKHFERNNLLYERQYGYRKNRSTAHAVYSTIESIKLGLDSGKVCGLLLIDMTKAFDSVRKQVLLEKLGCYGVGDKARGLIGSYLSDRMQSVQTATVKSPLLPITTGLPQGSLHGPICFLIVINDLPKVCTGEVNIFADDTTVVYICDTREELEAKMQADLTSISK